MVKTKDSILLTVNSAKNLDNCIGESGKKASHGCPEEEPAKAGNESGRFLSLEPRASSVFSLRRGGKSQILVFKPADGDEEPATVLVASGEVNPGEWVSTTLNVGSVNWSSYKGLTVDTLAHRGDEGRGYLR